MLCIRTRVEGESGVLPQSTEVERRWSVMDGTRIQKENVVLYMEV